MSERTDSQRIHEAMELCWHEPELVGYLGDVEVTMEMYECSKCKMRGMYLPTENPDYTDPAHYLEAMAWAQEQDWWGQFLEFLLNKDDFDGLDRYGIAEAVIPLFLDPKLGSHALASYLEGREG